MRVERESLGEVDLDEWSGVLLGGGPFCVSETDKSALQQRVEADLDALLTRIVAADSPFLGCCYGIGVLGRRVGAVIDQTFGEPVGAVQVDLTPAGLADPVFAGAGQRFGAFVGHKEAVRELPPDAVVLATSSSAPVQAFRVGRHVYATQFHPELDLAGLELRVRTYQDAGYFEPGEMSDVLARAAATGVTAMPAVLRRFVEVHSRD